MEGMMQQDELMDNDFDVEGFVDSEYVEPAGEDTPADKDEPAPDDKDEPTPDDKDEPAPADAENPVLPPGFDVEKTDDTPADKDESSEDIELAEIDAAIEAGAYGAKIVGSGGGGSIVALAPKNQKEMIIKAILKSGAKDAYEVSITRGSYIV